MAGNTTALFIKELCHLRLCHPDSPIIGVQAYLCRAIIGIVNNDIVHAFSFPPP